MFPVTSLGLWRWALEELVDEAKPHLAGPDDVWALDQAVALDGLHLDLIEPDRAWRLAVVLEGASGRLARRVTERDSADTLDRSFVLSLAKLQLRLGAFLGYAEPREESP